MSLQQQTCSGDNLSLKLLRSAPLIYSHCFNVIEKLIYNQHVHYTLVSLQLTASGPSGWKLNCIVLSH